MFHSFFLVGGAGFIGSHFIDALLQKNQVRQVTIYDNFSNGKAWHYQHHLHDKRFNVVQGDVSSLQQLTQAMQGHDVVVHLASNADISKALTHPHIDFTEGVALTHQVLEAARLTHVKRILYTSGSGVYGEMGEKACLEDQGNMHPISPYGASKLAGEAFISSYCHMFGLTACVFRFANVVGPRQTHGVGYDFVKHLLKNNTTLPILGDGTQSKSYVDVQDVVQAVLLAHEKMSGIYEVYNVASHDAITVHEIADIVIKCMNLDNAVAYQFTGGDRGWRGDVPVVRLNTDKIRALGWRCRYHSAQAIKNATYAMLEQTHQHELTE